MLSSEEAFDLLKDVRNRMELDELSTVQDLDEFRNRKMADGEEDLQV